MCAVTLLKEHKGWNQCISSLSAVAPASQWSNDALPQPYQVVPVFSLGPAFWITDKIILCLYTPSEDSPSFPTVPPEGRSPLHLHYSKLQKTLEEELFFLLAIVHLFQLCRFLHLLLAGGGHYADLSDPASLLQFQIKNSVFSGLLIVIISFLPKNNNNKKTVVF